MTEILSPARALTPQETEIELDALAERYRNAAGIGVQLLNMVGGKAENLLDRLPEPVRAGLGSATEQALKLAMGAAVRSRRVVPDQKPGVNRVMSAAMGAAGGMGGLPGALVELQPQPHFYCASFRALQPRTVLTPRPRMSPLTVSGCLQQQVHWRMMMVLIWVF